MNKIFNISLFYFFISSFTFSQPVYEFEIIPIPEMGPPLQIKSDGTALVGTNPGGQAVYWTDSTGIQVLGTGELWGISDNDRISAELANEEGNWEAALIENGETTFLGGVAGGGTCDAFFSHGLGISADGQTGVGMGWLNCGTEAFYWTDEDGIVELGQYQGNSSKAQAVSGDGQLFGGWAQTNARNSVLWDREGNITFLGSFETGNNYGEVNAISRDGTKVVGYCAGSGNDDVVGYIWTEENGLASLGVPDNEASSNTSIAMAVSDNCVVVGQYLNQAPVFYKACIYTPQLSMFTNLRQYLLNIGMDEITDWDLTQATCVSNDGNTIAGYGKDPYGVWTGWLIRITVGVAPGNVLYVPAEYATIQEAISASTDRDTIIVAPGTYSENINYNGKNIVIASYGLPYGNVDAFIQNTIIDGGGAGSVVTMNSGEDSSAVLYGFTIQNGNADYGGGIMIESSEPTFEHLLIQDNQANYGGGVYARYDGEPIFNHVTVIENTAGQGAGMRFRDDADAKINYCRIQWNTSTGEGGGIYCNNADPDISYTALVGNVANEGGDAVYLKINCEAALTNTTLVGHGSPESDMNSAVFCVTNSAVQLKNSILWGNLGPNVEFSPTSNPNAVTVNYCDVENGEDGIWTNDNGTMNWLDGNIDQDPLFCDSWNWNFSLSEDSPCAETGLDGDNIGAYDVGCGPAMSIVENILEEFSLKQNYPNPFNPATTIEYEIGKNSFVSLSVFDISGKKVKSLVNSFQTQGNYLTQWHGKNDFGTKVPAGLYLLRLETIDFTETKKLIFLK